MYHMSPVPYHSLELSIKSFNDVGGEGAVERLSHIVDCGWKSDCTHQGYRFVSSNFENFSEAEEVVNRLNETFDGDFFHLKRATVFGGYFGRPNPYQIFIFAGSLKGVFEKMDEEAVDVTEPLVEELSSKQPTRKNTL